MRILADENIPLVREAFRAFGEVETAPARALTREAVRDRDLLLVRSVTKVDAALLDGASVRFVGTATIGTDHVDEALLASRGIAFASAPGSNANSVAEWVVAALLRLAARGGPAPEGRTLGIVGVGNVGRLVERRAAALGLRILRCDPPRARAEGEAGFLPLAGLLAASDFVTTHVPLTKDGPDRTRGLADGAFFDAMRPGAVFLNASRGGVVDEPALRAALDAGRVSAALLDVWAGEPAISPETLRRTALATPHIAGYSQNGKIAGTAMLHDAAAAFLGRAPCWRMEDQLPAEPVRSVAFSPGGPLWRSLEPVVRAAYSIEEDDARLRADSGKDAEIGPRFTRLRKEYPVRWEFRHTRVTGADGAAAGALRTLGFSVAP